jgi:hypothetical protein
MHLGDHGRGSGGLVLPVRRELAGGTVVTSETVDTALDKNETELGVLVLAVALEMLADLDGLLDEHVEILGNLGGKTVGLEDANDLLAGDGLDLGDAVGITKDDADLRGGEALLGELADVLLDLLGGDLEPRGGAALVGASGLGDALSGSVKTAHAVVVYGRIGYLS